MTNPDYATTLATARALADAAEDTASKLEPGTYDAVKALATASMAYSLLAIASRPE